MTLNPSHDGNQAGAGRGRENAIKNLASPRIPVLTEELTWINWSCLVVRLGLGDWLSFGAARGKEVGVLRLFWDLGFLGFGVFGVWFYSLRILALQELWSLPKVTTGDGSRAGTLSSGRGGITFHDPALHGEKKKGKNKILIIKSELLKSWKHSPSCWRKPRTEVRKSEIIPGFFEFWSSWKLDEFVREWNFSPRSPWNPGPLQGWFLNIRLV